MGDTKMSSVPSERVSIAGTIDPDAATATAFTSDYLDMTKFDEAMAIVMAGTLGSSATVDAKLLQATSSAGAGAKDITGAAITQLTDAGSDSDKQVIIQCKSGDLDVANAFAFVALWIDVNVATSDVAGIILGLKPRHAPASDNDLASVDEIVTA
jgi:hypothetical protein